MFWLNFCFTLANQFEIVDNNERMPDSISNALDLQATFGSPSKPGGHLQTAMLPLFSQRAPVPINNEKNKFHDDQKWI